MNQHTLYSATVDITDLDDIPAVHAIQDKITISGGGSGPFEAPDWDLDDLGKARKALSDLATLGFETSYAFGSKDEIRPIDHLVAAAAGWNYAVRMYQPREEHRKTEPLLQSIPDIEVQAKRTPRPDRESPGPLLPG